MIEVFCTWCGKELEEPGAILLSPPHSPQSDVFLPFCVRCYEALMTFIGHYKYEYIVQNHYDYRGCP